MPSQPATEIYLNLPVADLDRAQTFYRALGFEIDERFTDENASMVRISDTIYLMLLVKPFFQRFTDAAIADTAATVGGIYCISVPDRAAVDELQRTALAAGAGPSKADLEDGPMYSKSFRDLDGHHWEILAAQSPEPGA